MDKRTLKKLGLTILAGITSTSVLLNGAFDSPREFIEDINKKEIIISEQINNDEYKDSDHNRQYFRLKKLIYMIPVRIRMILCIPLWFVGNLLLTLFHMLFNTMLKPAVSVIVGFILQSIILLIVIAIGIRVLFPDLTWSKIFSKKTILIVLISSLIMSICDILLPTIWKQYNFYISIVKLIIGLIVVVIVMRPFIKSKKENMYAYQIEYNID